MARPEDDRSDSTSVQVQLGQTSGNGRVTSIDVYRGLVMFLMLAEMLHLSGLAKAFPDVLVFQWIEFHTTHVSWVGCSLHDLIQPGFSFLVGAALPFSIASRRRKGQSVAAMCVHAAWRSFLLIALGIFLRSLNYDYTNFTFEDTLTQIGLGYFLLFVIGLLPGWATYVSIGCILLGYWSLFAIYPVPQNFDFAAVGVPQDWPYFHDGFAAHWNKNSNAAWAFDVWFMNLFPRPEPFTHNGGGYSTLSFIPTLATMLLGVLGGRWLKEISTFSPRLLRFGLAIAICMLLGYSIAEAGYCPLVKRIWTPTFALWSGGWCFAFLLALHLICDVLQWRAWAFPLIVIGANSIAIYVMEWTLAKFIHAALERHLGTGVLGVFGPTFSAGLNGALTLAILWLILLWMYRKKIYIKI